LEYSIETDDRFPNSGEETNMIRVTLTILIICALTSAAAFAEDKREEGRDKSPKDRKVEKVGDLCRDAVDPYNPGAERAKFFRAAGVDNELDASEFKADQAKKDGFVRRFDRFESMLAFDKNGNRTMDWFEADAYRRDMRKRVIAAFDKNKNRFLDGDERIAASRALVSGKIPRSRTDSSRRGRDGEGDVWIAVEDAPAEEKKSDKSGEKKDESKKDESEKGESRKSDEQRKKEFMEKYDTNKDGRIDDNERRAYYEARKQEYMLRNYDANKDGKIDEQEKEAMEKKREEQRQKYLLNRWDRNKDGQLDEEEKSSMNKYYEERKKRYEEYRQIRDGFRKQADADGDGNLNDDERKKYSESIKHYWNVTRYDKDGDGELNEEEKKERDEARKRYNSRRRGRGRSRSSN
jgi:hypothetical protein